MRCGQSGDDIAEAGLHPMGELWAPSQGIILHHWYAFVAISLRWALSISIVCGVVGRSGVACDGFHGLGGD